MIWAALRARVSSALSLPEGQQCWWSAGARDTATAKLCSIFQDKIAIKVLLPLEATTKQREKGRTP